MINILDLPMGENDAGAETIRDYLKELLIRLWHEVEGFSGKRPFGNSGWEYELYNALAKNGVIKSVIDEWGYIDYISDGEKERADELIFMAIESL